MVCGRRPRPSQSTQTLSPMRHYTARRPVHMLYSVFFSVLRLPKIQLPNEGGVGYTLAICFLSLAHLASSPEDYDIFLSIGSVRSLFALRPFYQFVRSFSSKRRRVWKAVWKKRLSDKAGAMNIRVVGKSKGETSSHCIITGFFTTDLSAEHEPALLIDGRRQGLVIRREP
ncbi:hypothetical protein ASPFODRAFT_354442 [Aspergillus luchuensis CBS 106.47]|uniref:Uncharacterized protein n=1 Tax=Aspergillus luchuensis (strain CBS 106.47) TaxID=1137211 RepID=A0A1M3T6J0_ASPLC|nr:hypothetical protein ASPFODRAFT_354442 [Aspergillus luchuensis CBS 106.47]